MTEVAILELGRNAIAVSLLLSAPMLVAALVVGLVVGVIQAVTQINEVTLSFVPKILGVLAALAFTGSWLIQTALSYTIQVFSLLPSVAP